MNQPARCGPKGARTGAFDRATWPDGGEDLGLQADGSILLVGSVNEGVELTDLPGSA
jgi:hypothetical protein